MFLSSIGALATLYDASCIVDMIEAAAAGKMNPALIIAAAMSKGPVVLGRHYFGPNPTGAGISPIFDFRADSQKGDANAF
ncbi:MAG TPA: hypothetical protein VGO47_15230, partial [Chlamydiales bacterium]|nr:hypothetical protein [Chlamydiales bacterium]